MRRIESGVLAALAVLVATAAGAEPRQTVRGDVPRALATLVRGEALAADVPIAPVTVLLGLRDAAGLDAVLAAQQDPRAARWRRWLDASEIADRFGPSRTEYERVRRWLGDAGLTVVRDSPFRAAIAVAGTAATVNAAFGTTLRRFADPRGGRTFRAVERDPVLPVAIADSVHAIVGLDDLPAFVPLVRLGDGSSTLAPADFATVYGVKSLAAAGVTGAGRSIAVIARSNFPDQDVATFSSLFLPAPARPVAKVLVGTDPGLLSPPEEVTEVLLDTEWAGALAPGAQVNVVIGTQAGNIPEALQHAIEGRLGDVVSVSFGLCEPLARTGATELFDVLYAVANAQGQTIVVASGDTGATGCLPADQRIAVNAIASSPHAIAVGGTRLDPHFDANGNATGYGGEAVWNDGDGASGGGESAVFARPRYQLGPGLPDLRGRALPDLALAASPAEPGYAVVKGGVPRPVGGTSAATPAFASVLALLGQTQGGSLGGLGPALYRLADEQARGLRAPVFRDVTAGSNGIFAAGPGFDLATGWGSPIVDALAAAVPHAAVCDQIESCVVPANGGRRRACTGEWLIEGSALARRRRGGIPLARQKCRDGDPACDADGTADGRCTIPVALCVNVVDARRTFAGHHPACEPGSIRRIRVLAPSRAGDANRAAVGAAIAGLPELPLGLRDACSQTVPIVVPAHAGRHPGRVRLAVRVTGSEATVTARATLLCGS